MRLVAALLLLLGLLLAAQAAGQPGHPAGLRGGWRVMPPYKPGRQHWSCQPAPDALSPQADGRYHPVRRLCRLLDLEWLLEPDAPAPDGLLRA